MIPFIKVVSLLFRVFSKPLINYTKMYHATNHIQSEYLRRFFVLLGNRYHKFQTYVNRRYLKVANQFAFKPLNDGLALEKGIQFFYEIVFYLIILGFPIYELYLAAEESKEKSSRMANRLATIDQKSKQLSSKIQKLIQLKKANEQLQWQALKHNFSNLTQFRWIDNPGQVSTARFLLNYRTVSMKNFKSSVI